jgi:hypothetical protein
LALLSVELMCSGWRMPPYQRGRWPRGPATPGPLTSRPG